jgi:3,5-epimerase/4-reductase
MKAIVIGNGFIASHLNYPIIKDRLFADDYHIADQLERYKPDVVINCMGYCGAKNIDDCEQNPQRTIESNLTIPTILASHCNKLGIHFVHIGSGCIYYGNSPNIKMGLTGKKKDLGWRETDTPKLENASLYSRVKYACDLAIASLPNTCVLRIRMPISDKDSPRNLINKLLRYENVLEAPNSVTFLSDLVRAVEWAVDNKKTGIYHVTNPTALTHVQLLEEYKKYVPEHKYNIINEEQLNKFILAPRSNCILNTDKLTSEGFHMTPTLEALEKCIANYVRK